MGGYLNGTTGRCVPCSHQNCLNCPSSPDACGECDSEFALQNGTCAKCTDPLCADCHYSPSNCSFCYLARPDGRNTHGVDTVAGACVPVSVPTAIVPVAIPASCAGIPLYCMLFDLFGLQCEDQHCLDCSENAFGCHECQSGFGPNPATGLCEQVLTTAPACSCQQPSVGRCTVRKTNLTRPPLGCPQPE